jgi:hypothetical protein
MGIPIRAPAIMTPADISSWRDGASMARATAGREGVRMARLLIPKAPTLHNKCSAFSPAHNSKQLRRRPPLRPMPGRRNLTCAKLDRHRVRLGISFGLWILNWFDAGRAKEHFESRQRSTCRPDSPSSNLCASTADSDGVRNVRRHDRWLPSLDRKLPSWSWFSMVTRWSMIGSPCPTAHCAHLCLLPYKVRFK